MPKPIPDGYHSVTPYLICRNAAQAIAFYQKALGAKELFRFPGPNGTIGHAELQIGDSHIMMADEPGEGSWRSPQAVGGTTTVTLVLYVKDVDAVFRQAVAAGGKEVQKVENKFYGDRMGTLQDPFGHVWSIGTHIEDVSPEEMARRAAALPPMT
jgi:PhnB protein